MPGSNDKQNDKQNDKRNVYKYIVCDCRYRIQMRNIEYIIDESKSSDIDKKMFSVITKNGCEINMGFDSSEKIVFLECPASEKCECCGLKIRESRVTEMIFLKKCMKACGFSLENRHMKTLIKKMNQFLNGPGECHIDGVINMTDYKAQIMYKFESVFPFPSTIIIDYNDYSKVPL